MKRFNFLIVNTIILILFTACRQKTPLIADWNSYIAEHEEWQTNRLERLKSERGWLNLAGLFWLEEGVNSFGSDTSNSIVFPDKFPAFGGKLILEDSIVTLITAKNAMITVSGEIVSEMVLSHDQSSNTTTLETGSYRWFIVKRGDNFGIRLRDLEHPRIAALNHIPAYPFDKNWVVEAEYIPYDSSRKMQVPTVIENFYENYEVPGELKFRVDGKVQTLLPFKSGDGFFLIVGDATNGLESYGAGRFLYAGPATEESKVIIDFNRAYNPPCAFSPYATCPLPPPENILEVKIGAGEKAVHLE